MNAVIPAPVAVNLETGAVITVPFHIKVGDKLKVDTRNRKYLTRV